MIDVPVPVLVVGGGPVGLTTALALQKPNIRTLVVERNPTTTRHPKMDVTNGRRMEQVRRREGGPTHPNSGTIAALPGVN
jgi:2-polyprenyl-6-methoxyphenol hydroxylase-like FAD-dependent oxidoreductase